MAARILVVEDDRFIREVVATALRIEGYAVDVAEDGLDAWRYLTTRVPELLVLDLSLPQMDGLTLCRKIRASAGMAPLPILVVSATASRRTVQAVLDAGADDFLDKPFELPELIERVEELVASARAAELDQAARPAERV